MLLSDVAPTPETETLLARAMFPDPARVARTLAAYRTEADRRIFAWRVGGRVVSAAGVRVDGDAAEVLHLGTHPEETGKGYGRALLHAVAAQLKLSRLTAETDDGAAGFYRRSGFEVVDAAARGGRRRYRCTLSRP